MELLIETDPDVMIGYNIINFDLPYLYDRADVSGGGLRAEAHCIEHSQVQLLLRGEQRQWVPAKGWRGPASSAYASCQLHAQEQSKRASRHGCAAAAFPSTCAGFTSRPTQALKISDKFHKWGRIRGR